MTQLKIFEVAANGGCKIWAGIKYTGMQQPNCTLNLKGFGAGELCAPP